jgi:uncharacterized protein YbjT (DUF2867 family)
MILVTGATGNVGGELVRVLAGAGQPVRALTRDDKPRDFPPGVQQVAGDLNKPESTSPRTGPEPLRPADRVRILGEVLGRDLRFEGQPDDEARAEMSAAMPAEYVDAFFDFYVTGTLDESQPQPDVRDVTGRAPRTFGQWAQAHASAFRPS